MNKSIILLFFMCSFFSLDFWRQIVISLFTLVCGIPCGLMLDRAIKRRKNKKNRLKIIHSFIDSLSNNKEILQVIENEITVNETWLPSVKIETETINTVYIQRYELFKYQSIINKINTLKNDFIKFNTELELLIHFHSEAQQKPHYVYRFKETRELIKSNIPTILFNIDSTINLIKEPE